jgi:hypothetical protein
MLKCFLSLVVGVEHLPDLVAAVVLVVFAILQVFQLHLDRILSP